MSDFPLARAAQINRKAAQSMGVGSLPGAPKSRNEAREPQPVIIDLRLLDERLKGLFSDKVVKDLAQTAKTGFPHERRRAAVELETAGKILNKVYDKHFVEDHPSLMFDPGGDVYSVVDGRKGEFLEDLTTEVIGEVSFVDPNPSAAEYKRSEIEERGRRNEADWRPVGESQETL